LASLVSAFGSAIVGAVLGIAARLVGFATFQRQPPHHSYVAIGIRWDLLVLYVFLAPLVIALFRPRARWVYVSIALVAAVIGVSLWSFTRTEFFADL
jgi:hypothetical protein